MAPSLPSLSAARVPSGLAHRWLPLLVVALVTLVSGCDLDRTPTVPRGNTATLITSETWVAGADEGVARQRLARLEAAIKRLREETGTGWLGRQDDVTGYLGELSGGSRPGVAADLVDAYGQDLFGVDATDLDLTDVDSSTVPGMVTTRARQVVRGVPVLDGVLVFTGRNGGAGTDDDRVTGMRGRVFPGLSVSTQPHLPARRAARIAEEASEGRAEGPPELVVVPTGSGVLAWQVIVISGGAASGGGALDTGAYYVDATTGDVIGVRRTNASLGAALPSAHRTSAHQARTRNVAKSGAAEPDPNSVEIKGVDPAGKALTAHGVRRADGIELTDTTTPAWDQATRKGGISTYDASRIKNDSQLPGELVVSPDPTIRDPDAIAAQAYSRAVIDFYDEMGRNSWDGQGGTAVSSVNYGPDDFCNAFFSSALNPPQMVYGNPCVYDGEVWSTNSVYPDVAGHEMTHGVTDTSAGLIYAGQSGALNESFSDYFGNVIGNRVTGTDSVAYGEARCVGITGVNPLCKPNPDGTKSLRYLLNGSDFDDYLRVLNPGLRLTQLDLADQDEGGVHQNSAIWNNTLWTIRTQLAKIDNQPGNDSPLAHAFDRAVFGALTTRLPPTAGFVDARAAIEQVIIDSGVDPVVLRVAREVFDAQKICTGCPTTEDLAGDAVSTSPQAQLEPTVSGDLVSWLDMSAGEFVGTSASQAIGGSGPAIGTGDTYDVTLAGKAVVIVNGPDEVIRYAEDGSSTKLGKSTDGGIWARGLAGSDAGAAWAPSADSLSFVGPDGTVTSAPVPGLQGDTVLSVGTGGGTVAAGTDGGKVFLWKPGGEVRRLGSVKGAVVTVAPYGDNVLVVHCPSTPTGAVSICQAKLFTGDGKSFTVSTRATPFGAAMSADYAVWPEATGLVESSVAEGEYPETDLFVLSLRTRSVYAPLASGGQQGFPSLSGRRLVWQDAAYGGDDIVTTVLPEGL